MRIVSLAQVDQAGLAAVVDLVEVAAVSAEALVLVGALEALAEALEEDLVAAEVGLAVDSEEELLEVLTPMLLQPLPIPSQITQLPALSVARSFMFAM